MYLYAFIRVVLLPHLLPFSKTFLGILLKLFSGFFFYLHILTNQYGR